MSKLLLGDLELIPHRAKFGELLDILDDTGIDKITFLSEYHSPDDVYVIP